MADSTTNEYKNEKRRLSRSFTREGMFIADFVKTKYECIYREAATMYNVINQANPRKPDLRRTNEFRQWKNNIASGLSRPLTPIPRQKKRKLVHMTHRNIPIVTTGHLTNVCISLSDQIDVIMPVVENPPPDSQTPPPQPESPRSIMPVVENPPPDSQTPPPQPESPPPEIPLTTEQNPPQTSENPTPCNPVSGMIMELKIPLIQYPNTPKTKQDPKKILETAYTESIIEEGNQQEILDPSLLDEVPAEVVEKIIAELHQDPNLKDIMSDMERQLITEEEIVGLEIDVPDLYDPLEEELESMFW